MSGIIDQMNVSTLVGMEDMVGRMSSAQDSITAILDDIKPNILVDTEVDHRPAG